MNSGVILRTSRPTSPGRAGRTESLARSRMLHGRSLVMLSMKAAMVSARTGRMVADLAVGRLGQALLGQREGDRASAVLRDLRPVGVEGAGLRVLGLLEDVVEPLVDEGEHRRDGAEVGGERAALPRRSLRSGASPPRRWRCRRGGSGRCSAWGRRRRRACRGRGGRCASRWRLVRPCGLRPEGGRSGPAADRCPGTRRPARSRSASGSSGGPGALASGRRAS